MITKDRIEHWNQAALLALEAKESLPLPFTVLATEALDALRFAQRYWDPSEDRAKGEQRLGLSSAVRGGRFSATIRCDLRELYDAMQQAQTDYHLLSKRSTAAPVERADLVLGELKAALEWHFDDAQKTDESAVLKALAEIHAGARAHDAIASALFDYAELAERNQGSLAGLGGFEVALIDEARKLALRLREQSAVSACLSAGPKAREALLLRNRLGSMVHDRILLIRAAARFVYRGQADILKQVSSAYGRKRKAKSRREGGKAQKITVVAGSEAR